MIWVLESQSKYFVFVTLTHFHHCSNYAELLTAMKWLHMKKKPIFDELGVSWEDLLDHFKIGMAKTIASFHVSATNPESVIRSYVKLIRCVFSY